MSQSSRAFMLLREEEEQSAIQNQHLDDEFYYEQYYKKKEMKTISIKTNKNKQFELQGDFEFEITKQLFLDKDFVPKKDIRFSWSPEVPQDKDIQETYDELYEKIGEKLKEDFIKFLKTSNMKKYNLFLDDVRMPTDAFKYTHDTDFNKLDWTIVRNYDEFIEYIMRMHEAGYWPNIIAFDHDLADEHYDPAMYHGVTAYNEKAKTFKEKTGMDCAQWLVDFCIDNKLTLPDFKVHSMNPAGRDNINGLLINFKKHQNETNA